MSGIIVKLFQIDEFVLGRVQQVPLLPVLRYKLYVSEVDPWKPVLNEFELVPFNLKALNPQEKVSRLRSWLEPSIADVLVELVVILEVPLGLPGHR